MKKLIFISSLVFALLFVFACNEEQNVNKKVFSVQSIWDYIATDCVENMAESEDKKNHNSF